MAGAGPAGATVARILALNGLNVIFADPETRSIERLEVMPPALIGTVTALGLGELLHDATISRPCIGIRKRWGSTGTVYDDFFAHQYGAGFIIDRGPYDRRLRTLAISAGARFVRGCVAITKPTGRPQTVRIMGEDGVAEVRPSIVVDATGRPAALARRLGAHRTLRERRVSICLAQARHLDAGTHPSWLEAESEPGGRSWIYEIAGPSGRWERWRVAQRGAASGIPPSVVDASSGHLDVMAGSGWVSVGDAAVCFDPITSQGLANALSTAITSAGLILSGDMQSTEATDIYTAALRETFERSEAARQALYRQLATI